MTREKLTQQLELRLAAMTRARVAYRKAERKLHEARERASNAADRDVTVALERYQRAMARLWRAEDRYLRLRERVEQTKRCVCGAHER